MLTKSCPNCGPIDRAQTSLTCPACGGELVGYANALELALDLPPAAPRVTDEDVRSNERRMIVARAAADAEAAQRRLERMGLGR